MVDKDHTLAVRIHKTRLRDRTEHLAAFVDDRETVMTRGEHVLAHIVQRFIIDEIFDLVLPDHIPDRYDLCHQTDRFERGIGCRDDGAVIILRDFRMLRRFQIRDDDLFRTGLERSLGIRIRMRHDDDILRLELLAGFQL